METGARERRGRIVFYRSRVVAYITISIRLRQDYDTS